MKIAKLIVSLLVVLFTGCAQTQPAIESPAGLPPPDKTWLSPGKVYISNFYPGARAEWNITIYNAKETPSQFTIKYRYPDYVAEGYDKPPPESQNWVIIADPNPVLAPRETRNILVALDMPKQAKVMSKKWEFWISVIEETGAMIQVELCSRWLVTMK